MLPKGILWKKYEIIIFCTIRNFWVIFIFDKFPIFPLRKSPGRLG